MSIQLMNGAIPGQSLTKPLGAMPHDNPPQHTDLNSALEHMWTILTVPRQVTRLCIILKKGAPVEYIARTMIFMGFGKGMWTPDVGLMMLKSVMAMIIAIGKLKHIKMQILNPDKEQNDFLDQYLDMVQKSENEDQSPATEQPKPVFNGVLGGQL